MDAAEPESNARPDLVKIGDFARLAETNLRTLRYYEELGLLEPAARSTGGFRYYRETDVHRLRMIHDLKELGLSLDRIRELLGTRQEARGHHALVARVREALSEQDRLLEARRREIEGQRALIAVAREKLEQCATCDRTPGLENNFCEPCAKDGSALPEGLSALF